MAWAFLLAIFPLYVIQGVAPIGANLGIAFCENKVSLKK